MNYLDVCTGISAPTAAWKPLGWKAVAFSEIEKAPSAVLAHHYTDTPNLGDMTKFQEWPDYADLDVLVGGTPCQSFSIAGLRKGLADPRGNLMLTYLGIADRYRPRWVVWENVPGVLSSNGGRDFGTFLGALGALGYSFAYRVLDAQYFGLAQRRERVFVVGHLGDWRRAAEVLFERESLSGYPAPRRETREDVAPTLSARTSGGGGLGTDFDCDGRLIVGGGNPVANCLTTHYVKGGDPTTDNYVVTGGSFDQPALTPWMPQGERVQNPYGISETLICNPAGGMKISPVLAFSCKDYGADAGDISPTLRSMGHDTSHANAGGQVAVAFSENCRGEVVESGIARTMQAGGGKPGQGYVGIRSGWRVRRITPREAERLQGFPDDFTLVPMPKRNRHGNITRMPLMADGPRYKMLGNSMAVPVIRKIGERIAMVDGIVTAPTTELLVEAL